MCRFSNGAHSTLHDNTTIVVNRKQKAYAGSHPPTKSSVVQKSEMYLFGGVLVVLVIQEWRAKIWVIKMDTIFAAAPLETLSTRSWTVCHVAAQTET